LRTACGIRDPDTTEGERAMSEITDDLQIKGVKFEVIPHERTYTTIGAVGCAAGARGCDRHRGR
jgi:hypothetical protein